MLGAMLLSRPKPPQAGAKGQPLQGYSSQRQLPPKVSGPPLAAASTPGRRAESTASACEITHSKFKRALNVALPTQISEEPVFFILRIRPTVALTVPSIPQSSTVRGVAATESRSDDVPKWEFAQMWKFIGLLFAMMLSFGVSLSSAQTSGEIPSPPNSGKDKTLIENFVK